MITKTQKEALAAWVDGISPHLTRESPITVKLTAEAGGQAEVRITEDGEVRSTTTGQVVPGLEART
jgi:hypothetical protein